MNAPAFKTVIGILLLFILAACETQQTTISVPETVNLPKRIQVLAQSCDANAMYQTVIDLDNNEVVILVYNEITLVSVIRTGIRAEAKSQALLPSGDAPAPADTRGRSDGENSGGNGF